jgi:tetratricopeptide (TPR) repeat protein
LHSFAYDLAAKDFREVAAKDPGCAIAHWGVAMSAFHQLWSPPGASALRAGREEVRVARRIGSGTSREHGFIDAAAVYFSDEDPVHHAARAKEYERAMESVARDFPKDDEAQIFYALALIATAPPTDRSHANQKHETAILEPIYRRQPDHPGVAHYLIHACDSTELAPLGLPAARAYAKIAPSAPHALHMPSHIFTRLGLWDDSIQSNDAARRAAHQQGDIGEELHAMDYLTYAYLQHGRDDDAARIVEQLRAMGTLLVNDFKVGYAATAMPVRLAIERGRWSDAVALEPLPGAAPHVAAITHWARALAHARLGHSDLAAADIGEIEACEAQSRALGNDYWATQIGVLSKEARAWRANALGRRDEAVALLRTAADTEDALEKLPVTPGPIVPAREQLGQLLLEQRQSAEALRELTQALKNAPRRLAGLKAAVRAAESTGDQATAATFRQLLPA